MKKVKIILEYEHDYYEGVEDYIIDDWNDVFFQSDAIVADMKIIDVKIEEKE